MEEIWPGANLQNRVFFLVPCSNAQRRAAAAPARARRARRAPLLCLHARKTSTPRPPLLPSRIRTPTCSPVFSSPPSRHGRDAPPPCRRRLKLPRPNPATQRGPPRRPPPPRPRNRSGTPPFRRAVSAFLSAGRSSAAGFRRRRLPSGHSVALHEPEGELTVPTPLLPLPLPHGYPPHLAVAARRRRRRDRPRLVAEPA